MSPLLQDVLLAIGCGFIAGAIAFVWTWCQAMDTPLEDYMPEPEPEPGPLVISGRLSDRARAVLEGRRYPL
jgi:hypothetical protein